MSWPAYDRTTWGLILSVAALIGAFPLSLLANLATPGIRNWWAERSISSLGRRIVALERELEEIEKTPVISDGEERILRALMARIHPDANGGIFPAYREHAFAA